MADNQGDVMEIDHELEKIHGNGDLSPKEVEPVIKKEPSENGAIPNEPNEDDDPIVDEIPVFLSKALARQLFLFQYPVRPSTLPYDPSTTEVLEAKIKPKQQKIEVTMSLNTSSANFDSSKGEQIALNVDGNPDAPKADQELTFNRGIMDKIVLSSCQAVKTPSRYAVGIFNGKNELHLTPLEGIVTLKPNLQYLDKSDKTGKAEGRPTLNDEDSSEDEGDVSKPSENLQKVGVRFAKGGAAGERAQEMQKKTFQYQQKMAAEEAWVHTDFHHVKSDNWLDQTSRLFCQNQDQNVFMAPTDVNDNVKEYLSQLKN